MLHKYLILNDILSDTQQKYPHRYPQYGSLRSTDSGLRQADSGSQFSLQAAPDFALRIEI